MEEELKIKKPTYWQLESDVSTGFNRLKGKLFNLIEASIVDVKQCEAVKGLIKGFANDEYRNCLENMRGNAINMNLIDERDNLCIGTEALEVKNY